MKIQGIRTENVEIHASTKDVLAALYKNFGLYSDMEIIDSNLYKYVDKGTHYSDYQPVFYSNNARQIEIFKALKKLESVIA